MLLTLVATAAAAVLAVFGYYILPILWIVIATPLRQLPGPPSDVTLTEGVEEEPQSVLQDQWVAKYGPTIAYKGPFGVRSLASGSVRIDG